MISRLRHRPQGQGEAQVNDPVTEVRGLQLRRITVSPSGVLFPAHPYRVRIRWLVDGLRGAVQPVYVHAAPTLPLALRPLPLAVTIRSTTLAVPPRASYMLPQKADGASSPWLKPGVSAPEI